MNPQKVRTPGELDRADSLLAVELPLLVVEKVLRSESDGGGSIVGCLLQCQFGPGPIKPGKASTRVHLHTASWSLGWVGSPGALTGANAAEFAGLLCRGTVLHVVQGSVQIDKKQRRYVAVAEAAVVRCAAEPWAIFKLLLDGWDLVATAATTADKDNGGGSESGSLCAEDDVAAAAAATAVGAALGGCDRAQLASLRQMALEQHALTTGGNDEITMSSGAGSEQSSSGEGGRRVGRFRDVFRSDRKLRDALKAVCDAMRTADGRRTGPRQRLRKTSKREWAALQRVSARWPLLLEDTDTDETVDAKIGERSKFSEEGLATTTPASSSDLSANAAAKFEGAASIEDASVVQESAVTLSSEALIGNWGALEPSLNLPDPSDEARIEYLELKKKPQIRWMVAQLAQLVAERRAQGLVHAAKNDSKGVNDVSGDDEISYSGNSSSGSGSIVHLVDVGGGRGDLALVCCLALGAGVKITVVDNNAPSLAAGRERAAALGLATSTISFVEGSVLGLLSNATTASSTAGIAANAVAAEEGTTTKTTEEEAAVVAKEEGSSHINKKIGADSLSSPPLCVEPADIVFGLHCCGGLSEAALSLAIAQRASFAICTCCFRSHPSLALLTNPEPQDFRANSTSKSATPLNSNMCLPVGNELPHSQTSNDGSVSKVSMPAQRPMESDIASNFAAVEATTTAALNAVAAAAGDSFKASEEALRGVRMVASVMVLCGDSFLLADAQSKISIVLHAALALSGSGASLDPNDRNFGELQDAKKPKSHSSNSPVASVEALLKKIDKAKSTRHLAAICGLQQDEIIALSSKCNGALTSKVSAPASGVESIADIGASNDGNGARPSKKRPLEVATSANNVVAIGAAKTLGSEGQDSEESSTTGVKQKDLINEMPLSVTYDEHADLRCVMTLAESEDSPQQADAMAVVNRARLAVTSARFRAAHTLTMPRNATTAANPTVADKVSANATKTFLDNEVHLDAKQGVFPEDYSHRNRVVIGSVLRGPFESLAAK